VKTLELLSESQALRKQLQDNTKYFRAALSDAGFRLLPGEHPIIPVMIGDAAVASRFADALLQEGIYVVAFSFPVVPKGEARIRTQMSAAHSLAQLERAVVAFKKVGGMLGLV
jgi:glycine C-acetyltransferase